MSQCQTCGREMTARDSAESENCRRCALRFTTRRSNKLFVIVLIIIGLIALAVIAF